MAQELYNADGSTIEHGFDVLMTPKDVAILFQVDVRTVGNWARMGKLFHTRTAGGHRRYPEECVRALYQGDKDGAATPPSGKHALQVIPEN